MTDPTPPDESQTESGSHAGLRSWLHGVRTTTRRRLQATTAAILGGILLAAIHPVGLVIGGALTALPQRRFVTGVLAALAFGGVVIMAFVARLAVAGGLATALGTGVILAVTVAAALVLPVLGSLARGIV